MTFVNNYLFQHCTGESKFVPTENKTGTEFNKQLYRTSFTFEEELNKYEVISDISNKHEEIDKLLLHRIDDKKLFWLNNWLDLITSNFSAQRIEIQSDYDDSSSLIAYIYVNTSPEETIKRIHNFNKKYLPELDREMSNKMNVIVRQMG